MPTVLITGANRGIGFELARQYAADDWRVLACRRSSSSQLDRLAAANAQVVQHELDVLDLASVDRAAAAIGDEPVDLLVNNAGICPKGEELGRIDYDVWNETLRVNVLGPMKVAEALVERVAASAMKKLVVVTSHMGAITAVTTAADGGDYSYRSSKAGVNMVIKLLAVELAERGICVAGIHPGWVRTDMGGPQARLDVVTSVTGMREVFARLTAADAGTYWNYNGDTLPT